MLFDIIQEETENVFGNSCTLYILSWPVLFLLFFDSITITTFWTICSYEYWTVDYLRIYIPSLSRKLLPKISVRPLSSFSPLCQSKISLEANLFSCNRIRCFFPNFIDKYRVKYNIYEFEYIGNIFFFWL